MDNCYKPTMFLLYLLFQINRPDNGSLSLIPDKDRERGNIEEEELRNLLSVKEVVQENVKESVI